MIWSNLQGQLEGKFIHTVHAKDFPKEANTESKKRVFYFQVSMTLKHFKNEDFLMAFLREFYLSGSYKDCCNMKVICLIEISSCLVKHTEVTQKYISELTELKKSKDMQPDKTYFCISYFFAYQTVTKHLEEMQGSFCLES